ncbi:hypothetical protein I35_4412 [Burkholderia cenocepacia H111]|nr:hypothetical protein I35_4412 [Burkholderia cenocepacia H111]
MVVERGLLLCLCLFHVVGPGVGARPIPARSMKGILGIRHNVMILF